MYIQLAKKHLLRNFIKHTEHVLRTKILTEVHPCHFSYTHVIYLIMSCTSLASGTNVCLDFSNMYTDIWYSFDTFKRVSEMPIPHSLEKKCLTSDVVEDMIKYKDKEHPRDVLDFSFRLSEQLMLI